MAAGHRRWIRLALVLVAIGWLASVLSIACAGDTPAAIEPLAIAPVPLGSYPPPNSLCLLCHSQPGLTAKVAGEQEQALDAVDPQVLDASAHGNLFCVECHPAQSVLPHEELSPQGPQGPSAATLCPACHGEPYELYIDSVHGTLVKLGDERGPTCNDCHGIHDIQPVEDWGTSERVQVCGGCHTGASPAFLDAPVGHEEPSLRHLPLAFLVENMLVILTSVVLATGIIFVELSALRWLFRRWRTSVRRRSDDDRR